MRRKVGRRPPAPRFLNYIQNSERLALQGQCDKGEVDLLISYFIPELEDPHRKKEKEAVKFPFPGEGHIPKKPREGVPNVGPYEGLH